MRREFRTAIFLFYAILCSCATPSASTIKNKPAYSGVDPQLAPYVDEYVALAAKQKVQFTGKVTVGLKKIPERYVIGWCTDALTFREIDLDVSYWKSTTKMSKRMLIYHELTHCYCGRNHDYGKGIAYPAPDHGASIDRFFPLYSPIKNTDGYFEDMCPLSIMHPVHIDDFCARKHYDEYVKEMFNRCSPY